jgi:hypothetical protein
MGNRGWLCPSYKNQREPVPQAHHLLFPPSPTLGQLRLEPSNASQTTPVSYASHLQLHPCIPSSTAPSSCGSRWPQGPPETTRRTVKDDWPHSHPADLRSRHAIHCERERPGRPNFTRKSHQDLEEKKHSDFLICYIIPTRPRPLPPCAIRTTHHPHRPARLLRLSASPQPPHAQCLNTGTGPRRLCFSLLLASSAGPCHPSFILASPELPYGIPSLIIGRKLSWPLQLQIRRRQPGGRTTA